MMAEPPHSHRVWPSTLGSSRLAGECAPRKRIRGENMLRAVVRGTELSQLGRLVANASWEDQRIVVVSGRSPDADPRG